MVDHLIFNLPDLLLDHQLIAQHIVKLGWDGVAKVKIPAPALPTAKTTMPATAS